MAVAKISSLHPKLDDLVIKQMELYPLPEQFYENYKICNPKSGVKNYEYIGIYDLEEGKKADVIYLASELLQNHLKDKPKIFLQDVLTLTEFFETQALRVYFDMGLSAQRAMAAQQGFYHSRVLRYCAAKRNDCYNNLIDYGREHFQIQKDDAMYTDLLKIGLHIAMLREELREEVQIEQMASKYLTKDDPYVKFLTVIGAKQFVKV